MLYKLIKELDKRKYKIEVVSLKSGGYYKKKIENLDVNVTDLSFKKFFQIFRLIRKSDIIQTWMYHADFFGFIITRFNNKKIKLMWGIRRANLNTKENKRSTLIISKINAYFSKKVDKVISCSIIGKKNHINYGFSKENLIVIPNGFDLEKLKFDNDIRKNIRRRLDLEDKDIILNIGRWNIAKDHVNLIMAYKRIETNRTHLIMIGPNISSDNTELIKIIEEQKIENYSLLGSKENIIDYLCAADVYVSSSRSEGFPNVIGEAMACELPCVVTDAGDSKYIIGDYGVCVPIEDSNELSKGIDEILTLSYKQKRQLGRNCRLRIENNFDIKVVTKMFEEQYKLDEDDLI